MHPEHKFCDQSASRRTRANFKDFMRLSSSSPSPAGGNRRSLLSFSPSLPRARPRLPVSFSFDRSVRPSFSRPDNATTMDLCRVYRARLGHGRQIVQVLSIFEKNLSCENIGDAIRATLRDEFGKRRKAEKAGHKTRVHGCICRPSQGRRGGRRRGCCQLFSRGTNL